MLQRFCFYVVLSGLSFLHVGCKTPIYYHEGVVVALTHPEPSCGEIERMENWLQSIQEVKYWSRRLKEETRIDRLKKYGAALEAAVKHVETGLDPSWSNSGIDLEYQWSLPAIQEPAEKIKLIGGTINGLELPRDWIQYHLELREPYRYEFKWQRTGSVLEYCLLKSSVQLLFEVTDVEGEVLYYQRVGF